ncbi:hypothetical protein [Oceanobacillus saliphilus]|uniref:hypothetical protein n=1 Tax=Oceanobacillus saliphilus TaxID=2925834 RepID=UPI00201D826F|nr:hypothetical protein [Oceanobacillus saliphilus]
METINGKRNVPMIVSAVGGITLGWFIKNYLSKQRQLEEHQSIVERLKEFERQLYEDGQKRAKAIESIQEEVTNKI